MKVPPMHQCYKAFYGRNIGATTLSIMTPSIMTLRVTRHSTMALSVTRHSIMTISIIKCESQHNGIQRS
jgi:hypothetical protein